MILDYLDAFFSPIPLWRRARGGHWEEWYVEAPVQAPVWHRVDECTYDADGLEVRRRPTPLCRGRAKCETRRA